MTRKTPSMSEVRSVRRRAHAASVASVMEFLDYLAPPGLSHPEEPHGLQIGTPSALVRTVVVAPMATFDSVSLAAGHRDALLVTAAPLIRRPLGVLRRDDPIGERAMQLVERRVSLYCLPNSLAAAPGGFDDSLAECLGLAATTVLLPTMYEQLLKIAVFVPHASVRAVMTAAAEAGAGHIGKYSHCSFAIPGKGTFVPCDGSHPSVGAVGNLQETDEARLEMIVQQRELQGVIAAVIDAHPYEEVAYDIYPLNNPGTPYGRGRLGELPLNVSIDTVLAQVQDALGVESVRCSHRADYPISRLAAASGLSDGMLSLASRARAGALVTGGASLEDWMLAEHSATVLIDVGFAASVRPGMQRLCTQLRKTFGPDGVEVVFAG